MVEGKLRDTNSADDSKGTFFGLEGNLAYWPGGFAFGGIVFFTLLTRNLHYPYVVAAFVSFIPTVIVFFVIVTLVNKKPPGYLTDWVQCNLLGRTASSYSTKNQPTRPTPRVDGQ